MISLIVHKQVATNRKDEIQESCPFMGKGIN